MIHPLSRRTTLTLFAATSLFLPSPTHAANKTYVGSVNGSWNVSTNWSLPGVPLAGDAASFNLFVSLSSNFLFNGNYSPGAGALGSLTLDTPTAGSLPFNFHQTLSTSNLYTSGNETVGVNGRAIYTQSAAINSTNQLILASSANSNATYSLTGTGSLAAAYEIVGNSGNGAIIQSAGTNTLSTELDLGQLQGSSGTYSLSGANSVLSAKDEVIYSAGSFIQSAGTNTLSDNLLINASYSLSNTAILSTVNNETLGTLANSSGTFTQSGGSNTVGYVLSIGDAASSNGSYTLSNNGYLSAFRENVGDSGSGTFIQTGGTHSINYILFLSYSGGTGFYSLSGTGSLISPTEIIADVGLANFSQSGGSNTVGGLLVANATGSTGTYSLTGNGSLAASSETIGYGGKGSFIHQNGGSNSVSDTLSIAYLPGSTGTYMMSDSQTPSTLFVGSSVFVGGSPTAPGGAGTLQIFDGNVVTIAGQLKIYNNPGSFLNFGGGSLTIGSLDLSGNPALFSWTGGTLTITNSLSIDSNTFNNANIDLENSMVLINSGAITLSPASLISGAGSVTNSPAGLITGPGAILAPLTNLGTIDLPTGSLRLPSFTNSGILQLDSPSSNLTGGPITNAGTIQGAGKISTPLSNSPGATIEPAGTLVLSSSLSNPAGATLRIPANSKLLLTGSFPLNSGSILLTGGTLDAANQPLTNAGTLSGFGTLATGTLTNTGSLQFSGGPSSITSPILSTPSSHISVASNSTATFYSPVTLSPGSTFDVAPSATAVFFAPVTGAAQFTGSGVKDFESGASSPSSIDTQTLGSTTVESPASLTTSYLHESSLTTSGPINLLPNSPASALSSLIINSTGSLDLSNNTLTISSIAPDTLRQYLYTHELFSSSSDSTHTLAYTFSAGPQARVSLALIGDLNLDGKITPDDYALLDRNFAKHLTDPHWTDGDFNYDGIIDQNDYLLIDRALYQAQGFSPGFLSQRESQFGPPYVQSLLTSLPEPVTSLLFCLPFSAFLRMRSRRTGRRPNQ